MKNATINVKLRRMKCYLGSSPFLVLGSENFLKKMSSFLTTMETRQAGHSQSPSGQEATPRALEIEFDDIDIKSYFVLLTFFFHTQNWLSCYSQSEEFFFQPKYQLSLSWTPSPLLFSGV